MPLKDLGKAENQEESKILHSTSGDSPKASSAPWDRHDGNQERSVFQRQLQWLQEDAWRRAKGRWEPRHPHPEWSRPSARLIGGMEGCSLAGDSSGKHILDNFQYIDGNTDLANAQVILLGETHIPQHHKDIVTFINAYANDGDLVLVEGVKASKKIDKYQYMLGKAYTLGDLAQDQWLEATEQPDNYEAEVQEWIKQGTVRPFRKDVQIYGWDNVKEADDQLSLLNKWKNSRKQEDKESLENEYYLSNFIRNKMMSKTIDQMRKEFPDKKLFVIAGGNHFKNITIILKNLKYQKYINLKPKYEPTKEDLEACIERRKAQHSAS